MEHPKFSIRRNEKKKGNFLKDFGFFAERTNRNRQDRVFFKQPKVLYKKKTKRKNEKNNIVFLLVLSVTKNKNKRNPLLLKKQYQLYFYLS
jgi:hypothetical protein